MAPLKISSFSKRLATNQIIFMIALVIVMSVVPSVSFSNSMEKVLYQAIEDKNKDKINSVLRQGVNLNEGHYLNNVALKKNREMFQYLLDMGGDINGAQEGPSLGHEDKNDVGLKTPLCLIVSNFLSSRRGLDTVKGSDEWVEFLLNRGADPNIMCYEKYSPLMMVTGKGADPEGLAQWERLQTAMKIIVLLIKNGADLNARVNGATAMDFAKQSNNLDLVMFLKSLGADQ
jgi:ankyrin repeat protein